jgi:hypothetical protein
MSLFFKVPTLDQVTDTGKLSTLRRSFFEWVGSVYFMRVRQGSTLEQARRYAARYCLPEYVQLHVLAQQVAVRDGGKVRAESEQGWTQLAHLLDVQVADGVPQCPPLPQLGEQRKRIRNLDGCDRYPSLTVVEVIRHLLLQACSNLSLIQLYVAVAKSTGFSKRTVTGIAISYTLEDERIFLMSSCKKNHLDSDSENRLPVFSRVVWPEIERRLGQKKKLHHMCWDVAEVVGIPARCIQMSVEGLAHDSPYKRYISKHYPKVLKRKKR